MATLAKSRRCLTSRTVLAHAAPRLQPAHPSSIRKRIRNVRNCLSNSGLRCQDITVVLATQFSRRADAKQVALAFVHELDHAPGDPPVAL